MKPRSMISLGAVPVLLALSGHLNAAVSLANITSITANGDNGSGDGKGGRLSEFTGGTTGLTKVDPNNPTTWTHDNTWQQGWQTGRQSGGTNLGWVLLDFNTSTTVLDTLYLWNVKEQGLSANQDVQSRGVQTFNIWYSNSPTIVPAAGNFDFSSGGWTQLGGTNTLDIGGPTGTLDGSYSLGGITARYVAIEILTNYGSGDPGNVDGPKRVGLAEIVVTQTIPEPGTPMLAAAVAGLGLLRRRRN